MRETLEILNKLEVIDLEEFFEWYDFGPTKEYKGPFEILAELESKVKNNANPPEHISISYRDGAVVMFRLKQIDYTSYHYRTVAYEREGSAS